MTEANETLVLDVDLKESDLQRANFWFGLRSWSKMVFGFWGIMLSGGGHFNLPGMLIISPFWIGLLFWPIWGFLSVDFTSLISKCVFLLLMVTHFAGIVFYLYVASDSELYWFGIAMNEPTLIPFLLIQVAVYLAAQIYLWLRFLRYSFGPPGDWLRRLNE